MICIGSPTPLSIAESENMKIIELVVVTQAARLARQKEEKDKYVFWEITENYDLKRLHLNAGVYHHIEFHSWNLGYF
jgi:hypothetical protein